METALVIFQVFVVVQDLEHQPNGIDQGFNIIFEFAAAALQQS